MTFPPILIALGIGVIAGICSGFFGIGGGIIIVPLLMMALALVPQAATATSLVALMLPVGALAAWQYYKAGYLPAGNIKIGLLIAAGIVVGSYFGAKIALQLPVDKLRIAFACLLIAIALRMLFFSRAG